MGGLEEHDAETARSAAAISARAFFGTIAAIFLLTITNPMTILSFAGLGLASETGASMAFSS